MAEALIRARCASDPDCVGLAVDSAGTWARPGYPPTDHALTALGEIDLAWSGETSRSVDRGRLERATLVLVMTRGHAESLRAEFPDQAAKITLMSQLAGGSWDIADPVGGSIEDYRATRDELSRLVETGWERIRGTAPPEGADREEGA